MKFLLILLLTCSNTLAQNATSEFSKAAEAYASGDYTTSISLLKDAQSILKRATPKVESLKALCYYNNQDYINAKIALVRFFQLSPTQQNNTAYQDMVQLEKTLDDLLTKEEKKLKEAEEKQRMEKAIEFEKEMVRITEQKKYAYRQLKTIELVPEDELERYSKIINDLQRDYDNISDNNFTISYATNLAQLREYSNGINEIYPNVDFSKAQSIRYTTSEGDILGSYVSVYFPEKVEVIKMSGDKIMENRTYSILSFTCDEPSDNRSRMIENIVDLIFLLKKNKKLITNKEINEQKAAWKAAVQKHTLAGYREFTKKYKNSIFYDEALSREQRLDPDFAFSSMENAIKFNYSKEQTIKYIKSKMSESRGRSRHHETSSGRYLVKYTYRNIAFYYSEFNNQFVSEYDRYTKEDYSNNLLKFKFRVEDVSSIEIANGSDASDPVGLIIITLYRNTGTVSDNTYWEYPLYDNDKIKSTNEILLPFLQSDKTNFIKIKTALEYLKRLSVK